MALRYWTGGHTKHRLLYHLVWVPKYRKRVLQGKVAWWGRHLLYEACKVNGWWIEEVKVLPDLEEFIWGEHLWAEGYFAETVGAKSYAAVKRYIRENADSMPQGKRSRGL